MASVGGVEAFISHQNGVTKIMPVLPAKIVPFEKQYYLKCNIAVLHVLRIAGEALGGKKNKLLLL